MQGPNSSLHWASFDSFTIDDPFWQDKMGLPVANKEFLKVLLNHGEAASYRFFCNDTERSRRFQQMAAGIAPQSADRIHAIPQALVRQSVQQLPVDVMHHGDFAFRMPHVIEWRNRKHPERPFPTTGVTHSLDTVSLYNDFLRLLLAAPKPYDAIICTSQGALEMVRRTFRLLHEDFLRVHRISLPEAPRLVKIPLGVPEIWFRPTDRTQCRSRLNLPSDHFVILSLARFSPRRKMDLAPFLECLAWLQEQGRDGRAFPPWTLVLAGAGKKSDLALVQHLVGELQLQAHVRLEPNITDERKLLLYGASDVFCSLVDNYQETFGLTLLEAMGQGLPVIASDFDGYKELVSNGHSGFLIPTLESMSHEPWDEISGIMHPSVLRFYRAQKIAFDLDALAQALFTLATRSDTRQEMGARGRVRAGSYHWTSVLKAYEALWAALFREAQSDTQGKAGPARRTPVLTRSMKACFSHYPSGSWHWDSMIELSTYGRFQKAQGFLPILYEELAILLHREALHLVLDILARQDCRVRGLTELLAVNFKMPREDALLHLDWLIKHGYLHVKNR